MNSIFSNLISTSKQKYDLQSLGFLDLDMWETKASQHYKEKDKDKTKGKKS